MNVKYVDAHCHLQFEQYEHDRESIIEQMRERGIIGIVVGTDLASSRKVVELGEKHKHLFSAIGLHPHNATESFDIESFRQLSRHQKVIAIGECGLDYFRLKETDKEIKHKQKEVLQKHIAFAAELNKPLIIHARPSRGTMNAYHDLIQILKEEKIKHSNLRGNIHFFAGGIKEAQALIALDFTISFTAVVTFARDYDEIIRTVPLMSILCETDAPYVAPLSRRGERNDPLAVQDVAEKIAKIRDEDCEIVRQTLLANAHRLFALSMLS